MKSAPSRPERVFIGPFQFDILWSTNELKLAAEQPGNYLGLTDQRSSRIWIADDQAPVVERDTLLHEILHGIIATFGAPLDLDRAEEERIVATLAPVLLGVLRENPLLVSYLTSLTKD